MKIVYKDLETMPFKLKRNVGNIRLFEKLSKNYFDES